MKRVDFLQAKITTPNAKISGSTLYLPKLKRKYYTPVTPGDNDNKL